MVNLKEFLIIQIIIIASIFAIYYLFLRDNTTQKPASPSKTKIDTVYIELERKEIKINNSKGKLRKIDSSKAINEAFIAELDTVLVGDTISMSYVYPDNTFNLDISPKRDSILVQNLVSERIIYKEESWWENPVYLLFGVIIGYIAAIL